MFTIRENQHQQAILFVGPSVEGFTKASNGVLIKLVRSDEVTAVIFNLLVRVPATAWKRFFA